MFGLEPHVLLLLGVCLLAACASASETDAVYARRCVPRKARIDLIYQRRRSTAMDLGLMLRTLRRALKLGK